jgi:uncharacterized Ntn-hydrolase superfamily protein
MTFAIAGRCERTGRFGVAISTNPVAVGARCPFVAPNVGVVVTMATTDPRLGPLGLNLLAQGFSASATLAHIAGSDPRIEFRQICVIDRDGNAVARTGANNKVWSGAVTRRNLVAMGNYLTSERSAQAMAAPWEATAALEKTNGWRNRASYTSCRPCRTKHSQEGACNARHRFRTRRPGPGEARRRHLLFPDGRADARRREGLH